MSTTPNSRIQLDLHGDDPIAWAASFNCKAKPAEGCPDEFIITGGRYQLLGLLACYYDLDQSGDPIDMADVDYAITQFEG